MYAVFLSLKLMTWLLRADPFMSYTLRLAPTDRTNATLYTHYFVYKVYNTFLCVNVVTCAC